MSTYVVELFRWNVTNNKYESHGDCVMTLSTTDGSFRVSSLDKKSQVYVDANMAKDDMCIISREEHKIASLYNISQVCEDDTKHVKTTSNRCVTSKSPIFAPDLVIDYEIKLGQKKFGIRFDSRSNASGDNFFDEYTKIKTRYRSVTFYQSGNVRIEGMKTENGYTGLCVEYYDTKSPKVKYIGEFEDGKYDGEGDFFSEDGNIRLSCKNICSGKPNGTGRLVIGRNHETKNITMKDFSDLVPYSDNYTCDIYARIDPKFQDTLELLNFSALSLDDRVMYLFHEMRKLRAANTVSGPSSNPSRVGRSFFGF